MSSAEELPEFPPSFFNNEEFRDPIDGVCVAALDRLGKIHRQDDNFDLEGGDVMFEELGPEEPDRRESSTVFFASAFDVIHPDLMETSEPAEYLQNIVAALVRNGLRTQSQQAGNTVTQLLPTDEALQSHVSKVWQQNTFARHGKMEFSVYSFYCGRDIADIICMPTSDGTWNIGYKIIISHLLFHWGKYFHKKPSDGILALDPVNP